MLTGAAVSGCAVEPLDSLADVRMVHFVGEKVHQHFISSPSRSSFR